MCRALVCVAELCSPRDVFGQALEGSDVLPQSIPGRPHAIGWEIDSSSRLRGTRDPLPASRFPLFFCFFLTYFEVCLDFSVSSVPLCPPDSRRFARLWLWLLSFGLVLLHFYFCCRNDDDMRSLTWPCSQRKQMEAVVGTLQELKQGLLSDTDG